jgi:hypothetical protein
MFILLSLIKVFCIISHIIELLIKNFVKKVLDVITFSNESFKHELSLKLITNTGFSFDEKHHKQSNKK